MFLDLLKMTMRNMKIVSTSTYQGKRVRKTCNQLKMTLCCLIISSIIAEVKMKGLRNLVLGQTC